MASVSGFLGAWATGLGGTRPPGRLHVVANRFMPKDYLSPATMVTLYFHGKTGLTTHARRIFAFFRVRAAAIAFRHGSGCPLARRCAGLCAAAWAGAGALAQQPASSERAARTPGGAAGAPRPSRVSARPSSGPRACAVPRKPAAPQPEQARAQRPHTAHHPRNGLAHQLTSASQPNASGTGSGSPQRGCQQSSASRRQPSQQRGGRQQPSGQHHAGALAGGLSA